MDIVLYSAAGEKKGSITLPASLFDAPIREGLIHQALVRCQSNRRHPIAHVKTRGEVRGSTRKLYAQKHTGRARRGPIRSPLMRGGGKTFGPRNIRNFYKGMPQKMRHAALRSCLALQAKKEAILALESYPDHVKTKDLVLLLKKLPVEAGRPLLFVTAVRHRGLLLSGRNIPGVHVALASYVNPEDVMRAQKLIFLVDAIAKADEIFGGKQKVAEGEQAGEKVIQREERKQKKEKKTEKTTKKKKVPPPEKA